MIEFTIPIRVISEANQREHWTVKNRRKKAQQGETAVALFIAHIPQRTKPPSDKLFFTLTRHGQNALDTDNLAGSFKHVQDAIAKWFGVDDGDTEKIAFDYQQVATGKREYFVNVQISLLMF